MEAGQEGGSGGWKHQEESERGGATAAGQLFVGLGRESRQKTWCTCSQTISCQGDKGTGAEWAGSYLNSMHFREIVPEMAGARIRAQRVNAFAVWRRRGGCGVGTGRCLAVNTHYWAGSHLHPDWLISFTPGPCPTPLWEGHGFISVFSGESGHCKDRSTPPPAFPNPASRLAEPSMKIEMYSDHSANMVASSLVRLW